MKNPVTTIKTILARIKAHNVVIMTAGIAFYATLAMVPFLIALVSIYAIVTDPADITKQVNSIAGSMSEETADVLKKQLNTAVAESKDGGPVALTVGVVLALFSASGAVQKLMLSINLAYGAIERRKGWKVRGIAYLFTAGAIIGLVSIVFLLGALPVIMSKVGLSGPTKTLINILRFPLLAALMASGLTILYRYGPDRDHKTPWKNPGALVGTVAFIVFSALFSAYFAFAGGLPASYGILGSIAAIIIFFQLSAVAIVLGAEVNAALEHAATLPLDERSSTLEPASDPANQAASTPSEPISLGTAVAGLAAIFVLGRGGE